MTLKYKGNKVLIIGGSSDMGLYLAGLCVESGLLPVLTFRNDIGLEKINSVLNGSGDFHTVYMDMNKRETINNLPYTDYFVDFSQTDYESLFVNSIDEDVEQYITSNFIYKSQMLKHVTNKMKMHKFGRLIFISSVSVVRVNPGQGYYASVKSGIESMYKTLGVELGSLGITTAVLRPGYINAGRCKKYIQNQEKKVKKLIPLKRLIRKDEVCETIMFLLSDSALAINSTVITIDGGQTVLK